MFKRLFPLAPPTAETLLTRTISRRPHAPAVKLSPSTRVTWRPRAIRHGSTASAAKKLFDENPFSVTLASFIILAGIGGSIYAGYIYKTHIIGDFEAYPEEVANKLRKALYFHTIDLQPQNALKYYQQALELSEKIGMDPFSDAILGVKLQIASLMQDSHNPRKAIEVLSLIRADCLRWLEKFGDKPGNEGKRTRILERCIKISVGLGKLYSSDAVDDTKAAEKHLVWAVTVLLRECKRREMEGVKEGEGTWLAREEIWVTLQALASHYFTDGQYSLAGPLFLKAYSLGQPKTCRFVPLLLNIAICLAEQQPSPNVLESKLSLLADARAWAEKTITVAESIPSDEDGEFCDQVCAKAMITLGEIARTARILREHKREMGEQWRDGLDMVGPARMEKGRDGTEGDERLVEGDRDGDGVRETEVDAEGDAQAEAEERQWFEKALKLSQKIGFKPGVEQANRGLRDLKSKD